MFAFEAKRMGYAVAVLDPTPDCPASQVSDIHIKASLYDADAIRELAQTTDVLTYEFEHVDANVLCSLGEEGFIVRPGGHTLKMIQDKYVQKSLFKSSGLPVPEFIKVKDIFEVKSAAKRFGFPMMLKSCTGGYDGKGNAIVKSESDIEEAWTSLYTGKNEIMAEEFITFEREISIVAARGADESIVLYPIAENMHVENILRMTIAPAHVGEHIRFKAESIAYRVVDIFGDIGVFCVEMFLTSNGDIYINEVAPRTHNSGHFTIEGCVTTQFEQHLRAVVGLPLGSTKLIKPSVMVNILGQDRITGTFKVKGLEEMLKDEEVYFHFYGKHFIDSNKKIGHITALADTLETAEKKAREALLKLDIVTCLL
jgi:5-(carboxyamino)imidazole ribonucleotide synthase